MWLLVLSGLIACAGQPVTSSCSVKLSPPAAIVKFGDPFSANCSSLSDQTSGMGWESSLQGTPLRNGVTFVPLNIVSATQWEITAICFLNLLDQQQCTESLQITVYKTPDRVSISQQNPTGVYKVGENIRMQCDIENVAPVRNLTVHWRQGSRTLHTDTFEDTEISPVNTSSILDVPAKSYHNGTPIYCVAQLNFLPKTLFPTSLSKPVEVMVLYPPTLADPANETLEIPARSNMTLNCTATGNPSPAYSWDFPHEIQQTMKDQMKDPILTPSFQLPGTYKCTASNSQGSTSKYFTVTEAKGNRTTFAALVGVFLSLGALLFVLGLIFVTTDGTVAFSKDAYQKGRPTSSGPV